ncbi:MAG TPA: alpha-ketoacid dehydrogenase subunit beta [Rhizomicrobium sp.]|nr:alpha-ketoacid dehydrogenase subunit beta [Rhizomicrobium sp.]
MSSSVVKYNNAIRDALAEELERDETVFMMGEDVGAMGGIYGLSRGLQERFGKKRVFDTPISETLIVGAGVGAALAGRRPVVELQYADFVSVAMDEIWNRAAKWRYMHGGRFNVPLTILAPEGAVGGVGAEHSQCPEGMFWGCPGLHVVTPATPADAKGLLKSAIRSNDPVLFLPHKGLSTLRGEIPDGDHLVPIGQANVVRQGRDLTIVAWSAMLHKALQAATELSADGIEAEVIDPRGIRPFDFDRVIESVRKTGRLVVAHEAAVRGGPGGEIVAEVTQRAFRHLKAPVMRVGAPDVPVPQSIRLEKLIVPKVVDIVAAVRTMLEPVN